MTNAVDIDAGARRDSALVSARELALALQHPQPPILLDVRWTVGVPSQFSAYLAAHIPTAQWCDLDLHLADPPGVGGRHPLPDPDRLQFALREWGIDSDSEVVLYDGGPSISAARGWWVLRWAGLTSVRVLNGGFAAWTQADLSVEVGQSPPARPGSVVVVAGSLPALDADAARSWAQAHRLVDVRTPERFAGESEPIDPVAGHVPGAVNLPDATLFNADATLAPARAVLRQLEQAGVATDKPVGLYCGSGVTASHTALALYEAGVEAVLYPGSWSEWITESSRPVGVGR